MSGGERVIWSEANGNTFSLRRRRSEDSAAEELLIDANDEYEVSLSREEAVAIRDAIQTWLEEDALR